MEYRRFRSAEDCYFFTVVTEHRRPLLVENMGRLRQAFRAVREKYPFSIDAIVVLPDHLHTVWRLPEGDSDYSLRWMQIKRRFSSGFQAAPSNQSQQKKREKGVWQRRFWEHAIRDECDWKNHLDYIHYNPVKHGHVERVRDWPFSSFHRAVKRGLYPLNWGEDRSVRTIEVSHDE